MTPPRSTSAGPTIRPPAVSRPAAPPRRAPLLTAAIWTASLAALAVGGALASLFVMMPVSLDLGEMVAAGTGPWRDAALAALAFCGLLGASAVALVLWHRSRGQAAMTIAWAITAGEVALVAWGCVVVMRDWF